MVGLLRRVGFLGCLVLVFIPVSTLLVTHYIERFWFWLAYGASIDEATSSLAAAGWLSSVPLRVLDGEWPG